MADEDKRGPAAEISPAGEQPAGDPVAPAMAEAPPEAPPPEADIPAPARSGAAAPDPASQHLPPQSLPPRRAGFVAPLLGGAMAAALGFGLSHFNAFGLRAERDAAALEQALAGLEARITEANQSAASARKIATDQGAAALAEAQFAKAGLAATEDSLGNLQARFETLAQEISALAGALPDGSVPPAAFAALKADVEALKAAPAAAAAPDPEALRQQIGAELDARAADIAAAAQKDAEDIRAAALRDAALVALQEAVRNGLPYGDALAALGPAEIPPGLAAHAGTGVPSLAQLAESFPEAARLALEAALRAEGQGGFGDRALALLRIGTGARSLTPQEGTDPDAVLSRAEAAVQAGDLSTALEELSGLPPEGMAQMAAWIGQAQSRIDAEAALAALKP